ncbi:hypothetical protein ACHAXT_000045 [Thalassiosira profunda]
MKSALAAPLCLLLLPAAGAVASPTGGVARASLPSTAFARRPHRPVGWSVHRSLSSIRGGALTDDDDSESDMSDEEDSEEDELSDAELSNLEVDSDEEIIAIDESDVDEEEEEEEPAPSTSASGPPVKLSIKTALQSTLLDQHLEFTASRKRTVLSLRQAVSKTMRGRPPLACVVLKHHGRLLDDEETVDDILEDVDSDDEEESDEEDEIGEDDDAIKLGLTCDSVPPVDGKFGIEFREKVQRMSTQEIVEAYCANLAGMAYGQELQAKEGEIYEKEEAGGSFEGEEEGEEEREVPPSVSVNHSLEIRKRAAQIQQQFEGTLSDETRQLIQEEHARVQEASSDGDEGGEIAYGLAPQGTAARSHRRGRTLKGGAATNVRRSLQRNLNVNWGDTLRNSLLFLFFGYFGGRNSFSRTFLLMSSPLCFLIQTRPVKVAMKQLFYTIGEPPGILLSLLPAPQQAIMSLDYGEAMRKLYGEKALEGEEWLEMERAEESGGGFGDIGIGDEDDEEYDDDEYDYSDDEY